MLGILLPKNKSRSLRSIFSLKRTRKNGRAFGMTALFFRSMQYGRAAVRKLKAVGGLVGAGEVAVVQRGAHVFVRVHRHIINMHFVVDVRASAASALAYVADHVTALHFLAHCDGES